MRAASASACLARPSLSLSLWGPLVVRDPRHLGPKPGFSAIRPLGTLTGQEVSWAKGRGWGCGSFCLGSVSGIWMASGWSSRTPDGGRGCAMSCSPLGHPAGCARLEMARCSWAARVGVAPLP